MALINLRNALMAGKRLPYDAEVEYLESTGTQWIDTGINTFDWPYLEITCKVNGQYNQNFTYGIIGSSNGQSRWQGISPKDTTGVYFRGYGEVTTISESTTADFITLVFDGPNRMAYAGQSSATLLSGRAVGTTYGVWAYVGRVNPIAMSVASVKIGTSRDNLLFDGIPVRKGTVGYLYDRVSGQLFGNAGTGDFVVGPDVVPVEYIESHGTEWIDTGVVPTATDSFYCRIQQSLVRDWCLWGLASVAYCFSNSDGIAANGTYWGHPAIGMGGVNGVNPLGDTNWHEILCQPSGIFVDGTQINTQVTAPTQSPLNTIALFARSVNSTGGGVAKNGQGKISAFRIERNGDSLRKYLPVRVGTEGAMMDVLTRRIYRNAGTGAFGYGNDLKYPIPAE